MVSLPRSLDLEAYSIPSTTCISDFDTREEAMVRTVTSTTGAPATAALHQYELRRDESPSIQSGAPFSAIPTISQERLAQAQESESGKDHTTSSTVLYLAYGSNLCAETFLGVRGIKPLSQINVSVPVLRLTFDLPGVPYQEPCFANVDWRKLPKEPKLPPKPTLPPVPPIEPPRPPHAESTWDGELIGVVYEVTQKDYSHIIATEGGGASYKEIVVPCLPIPPRFGVPEKPPLPELPKPFLARTLFAPYAPTQDLPDDPRKNKWWYPFILPVHRPSPDYAQPSPRYLKLLTDGAREHELPEEYQRYLQSLQGYERTSQRQSIGFYLLLLLFLVPLGLYFLFGRLFADKNGKHPPWLMVYAAVLMNTVWKSYDAAFRPRFGEGERTERGGGSAAWRRRQAATSCEEEKAALLEEMNHPSNIV